jgi:acyl dehydratase
MAVANKHILHQLPVLRAFGRTAILAALNRVRPHEPGATVEVPGPELRERLEPRPLDLVRDYVRHVGGAPSAYDKTLPPHMFTQWAFPLATRTLQGLPYSLAAGLNAGCRLELRAPLPNDEPLDVRARLESIDDDGRRALLTTRVVTGTASAPEALIADMRILVKLAPKNDQAAGPAGNGARRARSKEPAKERPRVPDDARELARWRLGSGAGLDFAKLTGDFNPVHWIPPYARAMGFRNTILHGFSTLARAIEGLNQTLFSGATPIRRVDVRFTRPLVLPARVGLYIDGRGGLSVGDAPGGPAYMTGVYEIATHEDAVETR